MLKTISAALLAVSVLAAPALAAGPSHIGKAPTAKLLNAHAKMVHHRHHIRVVHPHRHFHKTFGMQKSVKHSAHLAKTVHTHG